MNSNKNLYFSMGGLRIGLRSEFSLQLLEGTAPFRCAECTPDIWAHVIGADTLPSVPGIFCGEDGIFQFYRDDSRDYQRAIAGRRGAISLAIYPPDVSWIRLYLNEGAFPNVVRTVDKVLQLLPMRQLLACNQAVLLHSSRIAVGGKAILFTAPSGTGKTTQAGLWNRFERAEIVGNDRTILRKQGNDFSTYGYPVDGTSPIYSNTELPLGGIVVLHQGEKNHIQRLPIREALKALMEQTAMDSWNVGERMTIQSLWLDLLSAYPVYQLTCTPDWNAVVCLKQQLEKDEVIAVVGNS